MSQEEFDRAVSELAKGKLEKPKRLGERSQKYWTEIHQGTHRFNRQQEVSNSVHQPRTLN